VYSDLQRYDVVHTFSSCCALSEHFPDLVRKEGEPAAALFAQSECVCLAVVWHEIM
jgi:hypothetical protein